MAHLYDANYSKMRAPVLHIITRLSGLAAVLVLAACGAPTTAVKAPPSEYAAVQDGEFFIEAVDASLLEEGHARTEVDYAGPEGPGTIVVDTFARRLYLVQDGGRAMRYAIGVGREGRQFRGGGYIGRTEVWPSWQPTRNMIRTQPELYAEFAGGVPGGLESPLGARALYLYRGGRDTYFRIHGTIDDRSIGRASSAGCIRLFNQDAIDLYNRVPTGASVRVRSFEESLAIEGPYIDDANGNAVPETPEAIAARDKTLAKRAEAAAAAGVEPVQG
jgi:lipoprotein-anchoring transpeptidase ErfK/SrfK